jgi:hypothetical protein
MPSSGPQVDYFPLFQTLAAIRHADSSVNSYAHHSKRRIGRCEAQSREPVNKIKKKTLSFTIHHCAAQKQMALVSLSPKIFASTLLLSLIVGN